MKKLITLMAAPALMLTLSTAAHADVQANPTVTPAPQVAPVAAPQITLAPSIHLPLPAALMRPAALGPTVEPVFRLPVRPDIPAVTQNR